MNKEQIVRDFLKDYDRSMTVGELLDALEE